MEKDFLSQLAKTALLEKGDHLAVALSGGADSTALLLLLAKTKEILGLASLSAFHVNHSLRGAASDADEAFCCEICQKHKIPFFSLRVDVKKKMAEENLSLETAARELRYAALEEMALLLEEKGQKPLKIATAHHGTDQLETVLFRLARGASLTGLCGIPPKRGRFVRPLLAFAPEDLKTYLQSVGQPYCEDATNDEDDATRNCLRHHVIPRLQAINPSVSSQIEAHLSLLREEEAFLQRLAQEAFEKVHSVRGLSKSAFLSLEKPLQRRVAAMYLRSMGLPVSLMELEKLESLLCGDAKAAEFCGRQRLVSCGDFVSKEGASPDWEPLLCNTFPASFVPQGERPALLVEVLPFVHRKNIENLKKPLFLFADYDKIKNSVHLRPPKAEDTIAPLGMCGEKSVFAYLREWGIPKGKTHLAVVAEDELGVIGLLTPFEKRVAARVAVNEKTKNLFSLQISAEKEERSF